MSRDQKAFESTLTNIAKALHDEGVREMFGVAGDPITPLIQFAERNHAIKYYGFRNEQAASYAASAVSLMTRNSRIGVVTTVAGPGYLNALTGLANASVNQWPTLLVCPLSEGSGEFQAMNQRSSLEGISKGYFIYSGPDSVRAAITLARTVPFGGVVLFIPRPNMNRASVTPSSRIFNSPTINMDLITMDLASRIPDDGRTLIVIGSGASMNPSWDTEIKFFVENSGCPFLAESSMARGILPESHPLCVSSARSKALSTCSSAVIIGGRLDWMLNHGRPPKWKPDCKFILVGDSIQSTGECPNVHYCASTQLPELLTVISKRHIDRSWVNELLDTAARNKQAVSMKLSNVRLNHHPSHMEAIGAIKRALERFPSLHDSVIVSEGANTMDVGRIALDRVDNPCRRLDAARWGTMGSGLGFVVAAASLNPEKVVIAIEGDSALGFSGMELETIARYRCRAIIFVFNNGGIYNGADDNATAFGGKVHHDQLMIALGGFGVSTKGGDARLVESVAISAIEGALLRNEYPVLVDVIIDPESGTASGSLARL